MKTFVLMDYNSTIFKSLFIHKKLSLNGLCTGGIFGFIKTFCYLVNTYNTKDIVVCHDKPPYHRKNIYPEYKADRKKMDEDLWKAYVYNCELVTEFLDIVGVPLVVKDGFEADDLIYLMIKSYYKDFSRIIIATGDDDLYQCLEYPGVFLLKKGKDKKYFLYGKREFAAEYPFSLKHWVLYSAMTGTHNNVKGIKGVGPATAKKALLDGSYTELCDQHKETVDLCLKLIKLPIRNTFIPKYDDRSLLNEQRFEEFFKRLRLQPHPSYNRCFSRFID